MKKSLAICFILLIFTAIPLVSPLSAATPPQAHNRRVKEIVEEIIHREYSSADLDMPIDIAQVVVSSAMNECGLIEYVHDPRRSPDQMIVFIGYSLKDDPDNVRILYIHRNMPDTNCRVVDCTIEHFSKLTHEQYKTKFFYVESPELEEAPDKDI